MRPVRTGVQWTSFATPRSRPASIALALALALPVVLAPRPVAAATDYLLMSRSTLMSLPVSGTAWAKLHDVAIGSLGTPNLCDQNDDHHLRTLAAALVYARTGASAYGTKARSGVMAAIKTQRVGCDNAVLALGRQLPAYVLAADFANLRGTASDATFRSWLSTIRTKIIGGHSIWNSLERTQHDSSNNWGAYAGAARIAASLYLHDASDISQASRITRGFLGDRSAFAGFESNISTAALSWACSGSAASYTPVNPSCTKSGIDVDGAVVSDVSRSGSLGWPPGDTGVAYQLDSIQGLGLQVELLYQNGYSDAWGWSNDALKRMAGVVTRSGASGGTGWNGTKAARQMPWLLNLRYGTSIPTQTAGIGRAIGFTDWLYRGGASGGGGSSSPPPPPGNPPVANAPSVRLTSTSGIPSSGVPVYVAWDLKATDGGLRRYDLQLQVGSGAWVTRRLSSSTSTSFRATLPSATNDRFRVRAVDRYGRVGAWAYSPTIRASSISDGSSMLQWSGSWAKVGSSGYLGGYLHATRHAGPSATIAFSGTSVAWVGPVGPTRGKAKVYIDGSYIATVDTYRSSFVARRMLFARNLADGSHTLTITALGTTGRPTLAIDNLYLLNPA
jgi:hypothetical protein